MSVNTRKDSELVSKTINSLKDAGADKSVCVLSKSQKKELTSEVGKIALMRTTFDTDLRFKVIKDSKLGLTSSNKTDSESIKYSIDTAIELADSAKEDEAYDIAPKVEESQTYTYGDPEPDFNKMHDRLDEFLREVKDKYPKTIFERCDLGHEIKNSTFINSNGVEHSIQNAYYNFVTMFTSKDGEKTSSFNYVAFALKNLDKKLLDLEHIQTLIKQSGEQVDVKGIEGKFDGDIIITPDCLTQILYTVKMFISDAKLIPGTSPLKDKLGEKYFDSKITMLSDPLNDDLAYKDFITGDGIKNSKTPLIEDGVIKNFVLSIYGANKTGFEPSKTNGSGMVVLPGNESYDELVKKVKKGVLLCRFSGGMPNDNGDISGIAKNSYYIEDGEIKYPISETMITCNILNMLKDINGISKERINFGHSILPWISVPNVTISGK